MSEAKHTPQPWTIGVRADGSKWFSLGNPLNGPHYQGDIVCSKADSHLIVAAPDLLAALKSIIGQAGASEDDWAPEGVVTAALAAIEKAEGRA